MCEMGNFKNAFALRLRGVGGRQQQVHEIGACRKTLHIDLFDMPHTIVGNLFGQQLFPHYVAYREVDDARLLHRNVHFSNGVHRVGENENIAFGKKIVGVVCCSFCAGMQKAIFHDTIGLCITVDKTQFANAPVEAVVRAGCRSPANVHHARGYGLGRGTQWEYHQQTKNVSVHSM